MKYRPDACEDDQDTRPDDVDSASLVWLTLPAYQDIGSVRDRR